MGSLRRKIMASEVANNFRVELASGNIDFSSDTFKIILMGTGFVFDPDTHDLYADVSASELSTAYGYTAGGATLGGVAVTQNDVDDQVDITWNNISWTASGGDIGPTCGAIIYDDTATGDVIVGFIDFAADYTESDGGVATITNITVVI
jgi:predicted porin